MRSFLRTFAHLSCWTWRLWVSRLVWPWAAPLPPQWRFFHGISCSSAGCGQYRAAQGVWFHCKLLHTSFPHLLSESTKLSLPCYSLILFYIFIVCDFLLYVKPCYIDGCCGLMHAVCVGCCLCRIRLSEGFHFAASGEGIVNMVMELPMAVKTSKVLLKSHKHITKTDAVFWGSSRIHPCIRPSVHVPVRDSHSFLRYCTSDWLIVF